MRYVWIGRNGGIQVFSVEAVARLWEQAYGGKAKTLRAAGLNHAKG
jgi:hypothetical protein